ncbi:MAG: hypothetical protein U0P45_00305 [Acidimicrobiales bacterium]
MSGRPIRKLIVVAALAALVAAVLKQLRGRPAPQFSNHPTVNGGPSARPDLALAHELPEVGVSEAAAEVLAHVDELDDVVVESLAAMDVETESEHVTATPDEADEPGEAPAASGGRWVEPVDGACPDGYPVKAKLKSGIYHQPGGLAYDRTVPDRCYASAADAEADGLRAAKR